MNELYLKVAQLAEEAGQKIMDIYARDFAVYDKADESPLTEADLAAHKHIVAGLERLSDLPILSEESADQVSWQERKNWQRFWLVDPLDGTKEFIKKNGEFTVNIALIDSGKPVFGVVYAPALNVTYIGSIEDGAIKKTAEGESKISPSPLKEGQTWIVVGSRSHPSEETQTLLDSLDGDVEMIPMGSSLKLCLVAEGKAHLYPRLGPTSEWDTAAAQAVVESAGGNVFEYHNGDLESLTQPLRYNQKESVLNPYFVVSA